jgi:DNA topoisomerase VI subunit A
MGRVYLRGKVWYVDYRDAYGRRQQHATKSRTKTEAKELVRELEVRAERQRLGLDVLPVDDGSTVGDLVTVVSLRLCESEVRGG